MMTKLLIASTFIFTPFFAQAQDLQISVKTSGQLSAVGSAIYQAQRKSFLCKEISLNEGSPETVQKRSYEHFDAKNGQLIIPQSIDSFCKYERVGGVSISFEIADQKEAYNAVNVSVGGGNDEEQSVECKEITSGPKGDEKMIQCSGDVKTTDAGKAKVNVNLK